MIKGTSGQDTPLAPKKQKHTYHKLLVIAALILTTVIVSAAHLKTYLSADRVFVREDLRFAQVRSGSLIRDIAAQGRVVAANSPTLYAMEAGTIELKHKAGAGVKQGEILATIHTPTLTEALQQELATLERLKTELERTRIINRRKKLELKQTIELAAVDLKAMDRERRRAEKARDHQLISELDYEQASDNLSRATIEHRQAKQHLALEEDSLDFEERALQLAIDHQLARVSGLNRRVEALTITSPVDGMIGSVIVQDRQAISVNQALMTIVDLNQFEIEATVPEGYADDLRLGMRTSVQSGQEMYHAELTAIAPEVINGEVTTRMKFSHELPNNLRQNQRLSTKIHLQEIDNTLTVISGPFLDNFRGSVFKMEGEYAVRVDVNLGARSLNEIEILNGLNKGDTIIISNVDHQPEDSIFLIN